MQPIHQEGGFPTLYSNIYDLKARRVYVCHFHNFLDEVVIDVIVEEVTRGVEQVNAGQVVLDIVLTHRWPNPPAARQVERGQSLPGIVMDPIPNDRRIVADPRTLVAELNGAAGRVVQRAALDLAAGNGRV